MTPTRWEEVQRIFAAASAGDPATVADLLDRECGWDFELRREVESLLAAAEATQSGPMDRLARQMAPAHAQLRRQTIGWEGRTVGHYQILETCGSGAMGVIYKARDERLGRQLALKFLSPHLTTHPEATRRFLREARTAAALDHPGICVIHDIGQTDDGQLFIAMPLYPGETLERRLEAGALTSTKAVAIVRQLACALEHAHRHGVVHRDIKPSNVMLLPDGTVKVLDFGVARFDGTTTTLTDIDATPGTLAYMSPEQVRGETADQRADLWAVGVVLYEMLTGTRPFRGESRAELRHAILARDPESVVRWQPGLPTVLDELVGRMLAKAPDARVSSASAMIAAIDRLPAADRAGKFAPDPRRTRFDPAGLTPYTGRDRELTTLIGQLAQARARHGRVVVVEGEAGAGKSRLLHELREQAGDGGPVRVLRGRCRPPGTASPYLPFIEILHEALDLRTGIAIDPDAIADRLIAMDGALVPFIALFLHLLAAPSTRHPLPRHLEGEHLRAALPEALTALVAALARQTPTLILLDDWHWADAASREALRRLADMAGAQALLIVVAGRPEAAALAACGDDATRLPLAPLGREPAEGIMRALLGVDRVSTALARQIHERTGGNALFLEQICLTLLEAEAIEASPLPDTLQTLIRARLDRLDLRDRQAGEALRTAAVIGADFTEHLLGTLVGPDIDPRRACERLQALGLIQQTTTVPEPVYRFRQVLTQEVAYDGLPAEQRRSLHAQVARALEQRPQEAGEGQAARLAHHFAHAEAWPDAVQHGLRAAAHAARLGQFADALATGERVREWMRHLDDDEALADLLLQQERFAETLGQRGRQQQIVERLIALLAPRDPSSRLAQAYLRQGDLATLLKRFSEAERALETARRLSRDLGESVLERHALHSLGSLRWHEGQHAEARRLAEDVLTIDRETRDDLAIAEDLINLGAMLTSMGDHAEALARLGEALAMQTVQDDPATVLDALHTLANVHRAMGDADAALRCLLRADEIAVANVLLIPRSCHLLPLAHLHLNQGRLDEALRVYREAVDVCQRVGHAECLAQALRALGGLLFLLGRDSEALPHVRHAARAFAQLADRVAEAEMWEQLAIMGERGAAIDESAQAYERLAKLRRDLGDTRGELEALEGVARMARHRHAASPADAIPAFEMALALARTTGDRHRQAALHNTLGILAWQAERYGEALTHYDAALAQVRHLGDRKHEGLMLNSVGATLHRLGRRDEARAVLEKSVELNRATGERLFEAHALTVLGDIWRAHSRRDTATACFDESRSLREELGDQAGARAMYSRLALLRSDACRAI